MKKSICLLLIFVLLFACANPVLAAENGLEINAKSYILVEGYSGDVLAAGNENEKQYPASTTKIMTLVLALEAVNDGKVSLEDTVTTSENAANMGGSQVYLYTGEQRTLDEMLVAVAVGSGNDASVAVAEFIGGSESAFVDMMNEKAAELGMSNTHFANPHGLHDDNHYTTAADMAKLAVYATSVPKLLDYTSIYEYEFRPEPKLLTLWNTNRLLKWYDGTIGLKTGFTQQAGYNLVSCVERDDMRLIGVVMGAPVAKSHFTESMELLNYGFNTYSYQKLFSPGEVVGLHPIAKGEKDSFCMITPVDVGGIAKKGETSDFSYSLELDEGVCAPIEKGAPVGTLILQRDGTEIGRYQVLAGETVSRKGWLGEWKTVLRGIFC